MRMEPFNISTLYEDIIRLAAEKKKTMPTKPKDLKKEIDFALRKCACEITVIRDEFGKLSSSIFLKTRKPKRVDKGCDLRPNPAVVKELQQLLALSMNKYKADQSYIRCDRKNMTQKQKDVAAAHLKLMQAITKSIRAFLAAIHLYQQGLNGEPVNENTLGRLVKNSNDRLNSVDKLETELLKRMKLMRADR